MLITLTARSLLNLIPDHKIGAAANATANLIVEDMPRLAIEQLGLRGMVIDTVLLKGWTLERLDKLRMQADQAGCPCLILRESFPVILGGGLDPQAEENAFARIEIIARAAHRLGCNALSVMPKKIDNDMEFDFTATFLRRIMDRIDRMELNLLVEPGSGQMADPETLISLVKKVGGFRIGTLPSFGYAAATPDPVATMRQTAPFSSLILATCNDENAVNEHGQPLPVINIKKCVEAIRTVGYEQILAIDYIGKQNPVPIIENTKKLIEEMLQ